MSLTLAAAADDSTGASKQLYRPERGNIPKRYSYQVLAYGTWDSATAQLQTSIDQTNWVDITNGSFTADGSTNVELYAPYIRVVISGSVTAASITVVMI